MKSLYRIFAILSSNDRKKCILLILMMAISSFLEALGIGAVMPFLVVIGEPDFLTVHPDIAKFVKNIGVSNYTELIIVSSIAIIGVYFLKNAYLAWQAKVQIRFIVNRQIYFSSALMALYLSKPYLFHVGHNTATLSRNVGSVGIHVFSDILLPIFQLIAESGTILMIGTTLLLVDPLVTLLLGVLLCGLLFAFVRGFRRIVTRQGIIRNTCDATNVKWINQGIGAIKETKIMRKEYFFAEEFRKSYAAFGNASKTYLFLMQIPRMIIETVVVTSFFLLIIVKLMLGENPVGIVPVLGMFAMAAVRLMPSVNRIIGFVNQIKYFMPFFNELYDDLIAIREHQANHQTFLAMTRHEEVPFEKHIQIVDLGFQYQNGKRWVFEGVNFNIPKGSFVGIIGASGAGKTTFVDAFLGLLKPQKGEILVDGKNISERLYGWQEKLAYVPQSIYLIDASVKENIALGVRKEDIDEDKLKKVIWMAELDGLISTLDNGVDAVVGERGVKLSGGQRQRIGIARALYQEPEILVLDEATSALDNATEREIMNTILKMKGTLTILAVAHRLSTLETCDFKVRFENGRCSITK